MIPTLHLFIINRMIGIFHIKWKCHIKFWALHPALAHVSWYFDWVGFQEWFVMFLNEFENVMQINLPAIFWTFACVSVDDFTFFVNLLFQSSADQSDLLCKNHFFSREISKWKGAEGWRHRPSSPDWKLQELLQTWKQRASNINMIMKNAVCLLCITFHGRACLFT